MNEVVCLQKDRSESGFAHWIVFQIEFVESVERIGMCLGQLARVLN